MNTTNNEPSSQNNSNDTTTNGSENKVMFFDANLHKASYKTWNIRTILLMLCKYIRIKKLYFKHSVD